MTTILFRPLLALEVEVAKNSAILLFLMALAILVPLVAGTGMRGGWRRWWGWRRRGRGGGGGGGGEGHLLSLFSMLLLFFSLLMFPAATVAVTVLPLLFFLPLSIPVPVFVSVFLCFLRFVSVLHLATSVGFLRGVCVGKWLSTKQDLTALAQLCQGRFRDGLQQLLLFDNLDRIYGRNTLLFGRVYSFLCCFIVISPNVSILYLQFLVL